MATRRPAARVSTAVLECMAADDDRASSTRGTGWEPMTLSTAICSGSGLSRARGVDKSPSTKVAAM